MIAIGQEGVGLGNEEGGRVLADHKTFKLVSVAALMCSWSDVLRSSL